jgi:hypothetical protein
MFLERHTPTRSNLIAAVLYVYCYCNYLTFDILQLPLHLSLSQHHRTLSLSHRTLTTWTLLHIITPHNCIASTTGVVCIYPFCCILLHGILTYIRRSVEYKRCKIIPCTKHRSLITIPHVAHIAQSVFTYALKFSSFPASRRTRGSQCCVCSACSSKNDVPNGLLNCGSSTSARYTPLNTRSSVASIASSVRSLATSPPTKSSARSAARGGQCRAAVNRRLPNAAERQGGALVPEERGEKIRLSARNNMSITDVEDDGEEEEGAGGVALGPVGPDVDGDGVWASISDENVSDRSMLYSCVINADKSIFNASPVRRNVAHNQMQRKSVSMGFSFRVWRRNLNRKF